MLNRRVLSKNHTYAPICKIIKEKKCSAIYFSKTYYYLHITVNSYKVYNSEIFNAASSRHLVMLPKAKDDVYKDFNLLVRAWQDVVCYKMLHI